MFAWFRFVLVSFEDGSMQIFVKTMTFGTVGIKVYACDTINDIKRALGRKIDQIFEGYDVEMPIEYEKITQWVFEGQTLNDECTVASYDIVQDSTVELRFHLVGSGTYVSFIHFVFKNAVNVINAFGASVEEP